MRKEYVIFRNGIQLQPKRIREIHNILPPKTRQQLNSFIGEELEFRTKELINGSRKFSGKLVNCNTEEFSIENHKGSDILKFKFTELDSCKLKPNYKNLI